MLHVESLSKSYRIFESPRARLKYLLSPRALAPRLHRALDDVSFSLEPGQCLGVVGDNGAGKSTLLKLIAGAISPSSGRVVREGRLTAILELGAGFHPEFSGRENIRFAGALIGIPADEMRLREPEILDFAEIGDAIDRPVKTYSSGMAVRLAFALVTSVEPDILIIDEALAVGDQHFQRKCIERIESFRRRGCTILFCSHSMYHVRRLCDRAVWLREGRVAATGATEAVVSEYEAWVRIRDRVQTVPDDSDAKGGERGVQAEVGERRLDGVTVAGIGDGDPGVLESRDLAVTLHARMPDGETPALAILLERSDGVGITAVGTHADDFLPVRQSDGRWSATVRFPDIPLYSGEYQVSAYLFDAAGVAVYDEWKHCARFRFVYPTLETGIARLPHEWS
ncbi:ABC transporter ATP-binding protein [Pseudazoarcus pumilus]|uniref:ABC transporter ATP-binding protein n=1 Tax=Pseudazoarcus pumilus TaxID=2067960 RepID=A0A2I6S916_9RHOO|nr:ABC transporter ATP-binding protein [Pseudazoarcus pumilus]AUN95746.1 ABC transporter ATP-binding protein [Pseudazoarcus pumilus]